MRAYLFSTACLCILAGCAQENSSFFQPAPQQLFKSDSEIKSVIFEVDHGPNAQPYAANDWSLFDVNIRKLFEKSPKSLDMPATTSDMELINDVGGTPFSGTFNRRKIDSVSFDKYEIRDLAEAHRNHLSTSTQATYYILWLDGFFRDIDSGNKIDLDAPVLGITIRELGITAMFKPVIDSVDTTGASESLRGFVEQTTLIHEFGHSAGLVNNGLPLTSAHHDESHGAHCTNPTCVMYYKNEGIKDLREFNLRVQLTGSQVIFDSACLNDVYSVGL